MIETKEQMYELISTEKLSTRDEGTLVPQGLSLTQTSVARYYRWREGNKIATLRQQFDPAKESFRVENHE